MDFETDPLRPAKLAERVGITRTGIECSILRGSVQQVEFSAVRREPVGTGSDRELGEMPKMALGLW